MEAMVRSSPANQLITGSVKGLSVISCTYAPEKRSATQSEVHKPNVRLSLRHTDIVCCKLLSSRQPLYYGSFREMVDC